MLIKLTSVPHPDLNDGQAQPCYIDESRVLLITRGWHQYPKVGSIEERQATVRRMFGLADKLSAAVDGYVPDMADPVAVQWLMDARGGSSEINAAYRKLNDLREQEFHPRVECTEVHLACGTALEHGVMLARVWVIESVKEVVEAIHKARLS